MAPISASISTPVRSTVFTCTRMSTARSAGVTSASTPERAMGWHKGMTSGVRLVAMMAASFAASSTLPFFARFRRMISTVEGFIRTRAVATATRSVFSLAPTSTIFMAVRSGGAQTIPCSVIQRSASIAAMQPLPAAVTACR